MGGKGTEELVAKEVVGGGTRGAVPFPVHRRSGKKVRRLCACSPQANQFGDGLNQLGRIETHAIFEDQLPLLVISGCSRQFSELPFRPTTVSRRSRT